MTRRTAARPGVVVWLAGQEIDRFPSFDEYFRAMVDYNRLRGSALASESSSGRSAAEAGQMLAEGFGRG